MKKFLALMTTVAILFAYGSAMAKNSGSGAAGGTGSGSGAGNGAHKWSPKKRLKNQHKRIKQGLKNGTISQSEHQQLATEGKEINQERKADLAKDGGKLDTQDRHDLEQKLDARSKEIYQDKHPNGTNNNSNTGTNSSTGSSTGN